ncbi:MAG: hypothetical protein ACJAZ2_002276, partial [Glaciecola sp.]
MNESEPSMKRRDIELLSKAGYVVCRLKIVAKTYLLVTRQT